MKILSLDIGVTTGYCLVYEETGGFVCEDSGVVELPDLRAKCQGWAAQNLNVIYEKPVPVHWGDANKKLEEAVRIVESFFFPPQSVTVTPAEWKPRYNRIPDSELPFKLKGKRRHTQHERDAVRIILFAIDHLTPLELRGE